MGFQCWVFLEKPNDVFVNSNVSCRHSDYVSKFCVIYGVMVKELMVKSHGQKVFLKFLFLIVIWKSYLHLLWSLYYFYQMMYFFLTKDYVHDLIIQGTVLETDPLV